MSQNTSSSLPRNCAPWCEYRIKAIPEEHGALCESPALAPVDTSGTDGLTYDTYVTLTRNPNPDAGQIDTIRLVMDARGGHPGFVIRMHPAYARSLARGLETAADVTDALTSLPGTEAHR